MTPPADDEVLGRAWDGRLMRRLWRHARPHGGLIALCLLLLLLVSAVQLAQPWLLKEAIDGPIARRDPEGLLWIVALFASLLGVEFLLRFAQIYFLEMTGQRVVHDLRSEVFAHTLTLSSRFFDRNAVGRLVTRVTTDVETLAEVFSSGVVTLLGDGLKVIGIVVILFWMDARLALLTVTVLPLLGLLAFGFRLRLRDAFRDVRTRIARMNAYLHESLAGMTVVQLLQRERAASAEFAAINREHRDADLGSVAWDSVFSALVEMMGTLTVAMILWQGGGGVLAGVITFGTLVAFLEYAQRFFGPIRELGSFYSVMQSAMASSERIFALLDTRPEILSPSSPASLAAAGAGAAVRFEAVRFAYQDGPPILDGLDLTVRPGERVALVGSTGAGKTTLVRLLVRLYDPQEGRILLDGIDVRTLDLKQLRRHVGIVLQDHYLFSGTIADNIGLGDPSISREQIERAARVVQAHEFISRLPGGYDSPVRERGANFSVGEKQLLSFARALAFDPPVLVLDEATASVDSATESRLQEALHRLLGGRTCLVIAHRLSTIREADRILVLHRGRVREEGTHDELLSRQEGLYAMLHRLQFSPPDSPLPPA